MRLNELYAKYKDQVQFYIVYIREAHPADGWQVPSNLIEDFIYAEPTTDEERHCQTKNLAIFRSPKGCGESHVFSTFHGQAKNAIAT